jgi:homoserine trans-succinylase
MQISKQLKKGQNKKDIEKFEKQLEDLKSSTDDGDIIKGKILELENFNLLALFSSHPSVVNSLE